MKTKQYPDVCLLGGRVVGVDLSSCDFINQLITGAKKNLEEEKFDEAHEKYSKVSQAIHHLQRLGSAKSRYGLSRLHAEIYYSMGLICDLQSKWEAAMSHIKDSLSIYRECRDKASVVMREESSMRLPIVVRMVEISTRAAEVQMKLKRYQSAQLLLNVALKTLNDNFPRHVIQKEAVLLQLKKRIKDNLSHASSRKEESNREKTKELEGEAILSYMNEEEEEDRSTTNVCISPWTSLCALSDK
jgi:tetratricopeptide (TPR) repeat protein